MVRGNRQDSGSLAGDSEWQGPVEDVALRVLELFHGPPMATLARNGEAGCAGSDSALSVRVCLFIELSLGEQQRGTRLGSSGCPGRDPGRFAAAGVGRFSVTAARGEERRGEEDRAQPQKSPHGAGV